DAFWGDLLEADVRLHGVVVTDWEHGNGSLLTEWGHADSGGGDGQRHDCDVQLACSHRVDKLETGSRLHRGLKVGRGGDESAQSPRDAGQQSGWDIANPQHPPRPVTCAAGG